MLISKRLMKAIRIHSHGSVDSLSIDNIDIPNKSDTRVLIKVKAAALNHLDIWVRNGLPGINIPLPLIMGSDASGDVIHVGKNVSKFKVGDKVVVQPGTFNNSHSDIEQGNENFSKSYGILGETENGVQAEFISLPENNLFSMPEFLSYEESSSMQLVFMTAYQMIVNRAKLQPNEKILIYAGSSGVGSAAIQIAKDIGATVISTAGNKEKEKHAYSMGADYVLSHYNNKSFISELKDITDNKLCDVIFEHIGLATWDQSMRCLSKGGRLVTCGATTGGIVSIDLRHLFMKQQSILGSTMAGLSAFTDVINKINDKVYKPFVDEVFSFDDVIKAHKYIQDSKQIGKVVLVP